MIAFKVTVQEIKMSPATVTLSLIDFETSIAELIKSMKDLSNDPPSLYFNLKEENLSREDNYLPHHNPRTFQRSCLLNQRLQSEKRCVHYRRK